MGQAPDSAVYRRVLGHYPTGVCVVTATLSGGKRAGMVVGSFTSVSLNPPLIGFFPDVSSASWPNIQRAGAFCINILADDQRDVCQRFSAKGEDKFAGLSYGISANGSPVLDNVLAWIDCTLEKVYEAGDHYIVLGRVQQLDIARSDQPLLFFRGGFGSFAPLSGS